MKKNDESQYFRYTSKRIDISGSSPTDRKAALIDIIGFWIWKLMIVCIPLILALCFNNYDKKDDQQKDPTVIKATEKNNKQMRKKITIALVDDHGLFRRGMSSMIQGLDSNRYKILFEATSGVDLLNKLKNGIIPELLLLDISMPEMDGYETAKNLALKYPQIKVIVISMFNEEEVVLKMLKHGVKAYLLKDTEPNEFNTALKEVVEKGQYFSEWVAALAIKSLNSFQHKTLDTVEVLKQLNAKETQFIKLMGTDMSYQEMAEQMGVTYKSIDKYRESIFSKLNVKSRVGLVLVLVKHGIITRESIS